MWLCICPWGGTEHDGKLGEKSYLQVEAVSGIASDRCFLGCDPATGDHSRSVYTPANHGMGENAAFSDLGGVSSANDGICKTIHYPARSVCRAFCERGICAVFCWNECRWQRDCHCLFARCIVVSFLDLDVWGGTEAQLACCSARGVRFGICVIGTVDTHASFCVGLLDCERRICSVLGDHADPVPNEFK